MGDFIEAMIDALIDGGFWFYGLAIGLILLGVAAFS